MIEESLLINQNQILEDKFDQILSVIGTKNALEAKLNYNFPLK